MVHSIYCVHCGKKVSGSEPVYLAKLFFSLSTGVTETLSPACSPECVNQAVSKQINMMEDYVKRLKEQPKIVVTADEYMNPSNKRLEKGQVYDY